jgi:hypothetical protein
MRARGGSSRARARGRSTPWIALALAAAGVALALVILLTTRDDRLADPLEPSVRSQPPAGETAGSARTSAPDAPRASPPPSDTAPGGWRVAGKIASRGGGAVAGARVRIALDIGGEARALGEAVSAADGTYTLPAPGLGELDELAASLCKVIATVEAEHNSPARAAVAFDARAAERTVKLDVRLEPGERLTGRIVRPERMAGEGGGAAASATAAKPVPRATVRLSVAQTKGGVTSFVVVEEQLTDAQGRFDLGFASSGRYHLAARADGIGTAFVEDLDLEAGSGRDVGDLALAGNEAIAGTLTHENGAPAAHFELWAFEGEYAASPDGMALAVRKAAEDERGDGLRITRTTTDAQGRFALAGLRKGHYAIRSPDPRAVLEPRQARYEPPKSGVELKLLSYALVARVVDEDGRPVRGANVRLTSLAMQVDGSYDPVGARVLTAQGADAAVTFTVDPEARYALDAYTSSRRSKEEIVELAQNQFGHEVVVVLPRRQPTGRILLDVIGEDGLPLASLQVAVLSPVTGARREDFGVLEPDAAGLLPPLPCDEYDLLVGYAPGQDRFHFPVRTSTPVKVVAGDPVRVSLRPRRGGRISVSIALDGPPPKGFADEAPAGATESAREKLEESRRARFGCTIVAERKHDGAKRNLQLESRGAYGARIMPGETAVAWDLLEPDAYEITIVSAGPWQSVSTPVTVVAGETASAAIRLRAR